ncbi:hypothetical protein INT44_007500 [Umbelopsis vinacea]|uniref:Myb-like domain-containing protein n=1 Tax=Umbelopsis vinacea TaxID=44442 RepID=A0A8H7PPD0_9FUNG|nr:hypothetical protein INT44_007500 [Umbelopsis vinacea]
MAAVSHKPRSMTAGARNVLRSNDSASLWNCTLSPGWTEEESETLRKALMLFGIGNWAKIIESDCLPGKTNAQMNLQLQRLLGQQSTAEFAGLHIDPKVIGARNSKIQGAHIKRKNNCIVNTGGKLSREELKSRVLKNKEMYELPEETWKVIVLPKVEDPTAVLEAKKKELEKLQEKLAKVQGQIAKARAAHPARVDELKIELDRSPSPSSPGQQVPMDTPSPPSTPGSSAPVTSEKDTPESSSRSPDLDEDLAMAMRLQQEEDGLLLQPRVEFSEDEHDDDFGNEKKRSRISKGKHAKRK